MLKQIEKRRLIRLLEASRCKAALSSSGKVRQEFSVLGRRCRRRPASSWRRCRRRSVTNRDVASTFDRRCCRRRRDDDFASVSSLNWTTMTSLELRPELSPKLSRSSESTSAEKNRFVLSTWQQSKQRTKDPLSVSALVNIGLLEQPQVFAQFIWRVMSS